MREELRDPWGWLLAAVLGGLAWAVLGGSLLIPMLVATAVLGTKVALGSVLRSQRPALPRRTPDALPAAPRNSPAGVLLQRAERARSRMVGLAALPGDPWLRDQVALMDDGVDEVVSAMRDLAGRVTLADQLIASADGPGLVRERAALAERLDSSPDPMLRQERRRALQAVDEQLAGLQRLDGLRDQLLTRMHTAVVGVETVATRMGEVVTLGTAATEPDRAGQVISDAGHDLEALRSGLLEAQQLARGVGPD